MQQFYRAFPNLNVFRGCCTQDQEKGLKDQGSIKTPNVRRIVNPHKKHYHHSHILWSLQTPSVLDEIWPGFFLFILFLFVITVFLGLLIRIGAHGNVCQRHIPLVNVFFVSLGNIVVYLFIQSFILKPT